MDEQLSVCLVGLKTGHSTVSDVEVGLEAGQEDGVV